MKPTDSHLSLVNAICSSGDYLKDGVWRTDFFEAREEIAKIAFFYICFCQENKLPCKITNIIQKQPNSKTDSHPEGRAIDLRSQGWPRIKKIQFQSMLDELFFSHSAISSTSGLPRLVLLEDEGTANEHFHIQLKRK